MTGEELRQYRKAKGWTIREAARQIGISNCYLSQMETGQRPIPASVAMSRAASVYGFKVDRLWARVPIGLNVSYIDAAFEVWAHTEKETARANRIKPSVEAKAFILEIARWKTDDFFLYAEK